MKNFYKFMILLLATAFVFSGCEKKDQAENTTKKTPYGFNIETVELSPKGGSISASYYNGNGKLYASYVKEHKYYLMLTDTSNGSSEMIWNISDDVDIPFPGEGISSLFVNDEGNIVLLSGGNENGYSLLIYDINGLSFEKYDINEKLGDFCRAEYYNGEIYLYNSFCIYKFKLNDSLELCGKIESEDIINQLIIGADGALYAVMYDSLKKIDTEKIEFADTVGFPSDFNGHTVFGGYGENILYAADNIYIYGINAKGKFNVIASLSNMGLTEYSLNSVFADENGRILFFDFENGEVGSLLRLEFIPTEKLNERTKITITVSDDVGNNFEKAVFAYNRSSKDHVIEFEYLDENEKGDLIDSFDRKLISGDELGDILIFPSGIKNVYNAGLFEDLYGFIDSDEDISRDDFFEAALSAMETDGKLYGIRADFSILTYAANSGYCRNYDSFDITRLDSEKVQNDILINNISSRTDFMNELVRYNFDCFTDYNTVKCDFDNENLRMLMSFSQAVNIPDTKSDTLSDDVPMKIQPITIHGAEELAAYEEVLDLHPIGVPRIDGKKIHVLSGDAIYLNSFSENKSAAWDFIKFYLNYNQYNRAGSFSMGIPVLKSLFDKNMNDVLESNRLIKEENGDKAYQFMFNNVPVRLIEKSDYDHITEMINNSVKIRYDDEILNIVNEETDMFFAGDTSADNAAKNIQGRAGIAFSERN